MRIRRGLTTALSLAVGLSLVAAACGDDDDTGGTTAATGGAETTAAGAETTAAGTETTAAAPETTAAGTDTTAGGAETTTAGGEEEAAGQITLDQRCEEAGEVEVPEGFSVILVTDIGKIDDGTFNQYSYEGMVAASECFGFETDYIETASEADYATNIATALSGNPSLIITNGSLMANDTLAAAEANPEVQWIGIDQFHDTYPENYVGVQFREDQGGFLAGTMAALLSESGVVGVVGGREDVPPVVRLVNGYKAGAEATNPDINVLSIYNESFTDEAKGANDAEQFIGEGADVIFGAGGPTGSAGVRAATDQGLWGIGVDQDEYFTTYNGGAIEGSEFLATSAMKRVDLAIFDNITAALTGEFAGGIYGLDAANDGITYAPFHDADIPEDVAAQLEEVRQGLADGSIETGVDPATGQPL